jgi:hypothetical protein
LLRNNHFQFNFAMSDVWCPDRQTAIARALWSMVVELVVVVVVIWRRYTWMWAWAAPLRQERIIAILGCV